MDCIYKKLLGENDRFSVTQSAENQKKASLERDTFSFGAGGLPCAGALRPVRRRPEFIARGPYFGASRIEPPLFRQSRPIPNKRATPKGGSLICERVTKRSRNEVKVSKSSVTALFDKLEFT